MLKFTCISLSPSAPPSLWPRRHTDTHTQCATLIRAAPHRSFSLLIYWWRSLKLSNYVQLQVSLKQHCSFFTLKNNSLTGDWRGGIPATVTAPPVDLVQDKTCCAPFDHLHQTRRVDVIGDDATCTPPYKWSCSESKKLKANFSPKQQHIFSIFQLRYGTKDTQRTQNGPLKSLVCTETYLMHLLNSTLMQMSHVRTDRQSFKSSNAPLMCTVLR